MYRHHLSTIKPPLKRKLTFINLEVYNVGMDSNYSRRNFLQLALAGSVGLAMGGLENVIAAEPVKPSSHKATRESADALFSQGKYQDAIPQYQTYLQQSPKDATAHYKLGFALGEVGK